MKKIRLLFTSALLCGLVATGWGQAPTSSDAWINEIHYDNSGSDVNEGVEIVIEDIATYPLSEWFVELYNGNGGARYSTIDFTTPDQQSTSNGFTIAWKDEIGIQNGGPDGLALVHDDGTTITVVQFLSYEGSFTATAGNANGQTSTDIGVSETGSTLTSESLQLSGSGSQYSDFTWQSPATSTNGALNNSQTLNSGTPPDITISNSNQPAAGNINQGAQDAVIAGVSAAVTTANATLNTFDVTINGTFDSDDIDNFQLFFSTTNSFASATQIGTNIAGNGNGTSQALSFTGLSQSINNGVTGYFWVVADVSVTATASNTLNADAPVLTFASGNITNNATDAASGMQTIQSVTPAVTLADNGTQITAANVDEATNNHVLSSFELAVATANADLDGLDITTAGTYVAGDVNDLQLWFSSDNTFDAGSDQSLVTIASPTAAGTQSFTGFNQIINSSSTGYYFITVDIACPATDGNTISVNAITNTDLSFNGTVTRSGSASAAGTQTIQDATPADVTGLGATAGNTQATVSWTNPSCYDEIIIVAHTSSIGGTPTGTYTASSQDFTDANNPNFPSGGKVVYNGSTSPQTITGLTNGTQYFFKVFARNGSNWSTPGVEVNATPAAAPASGDLIITAVYDGPLSGGTPKGVELFAVNTINDLSYFALGSANNGGGTDGAEHTLAAVSINQGDYYYVSSESTQFNNFFGFTPDETTGSMSINGDDAIELFYDPNQSFSGTEFVSDIYGDINSSTGTWTHGDGWAYRNDGTGPDGSTFNQSNWNTQSGALNGETSNATATTPVPIGTYSSTGSTSFTFDGTNWSPSNPNGASSASDNVTINSGNVTFSSNTTVNDLTLEPTATLTISTGQTLTVNGTATLNADATGYAQVIGDVSGTANVESYISSSTQWYNVAFPVSATTLASISGITLNTTNNAASNNIYQYNASNISNGEGTWEMVTNANLALNPGMGFSIFMDGANFGALPATIDANGSLNSGDQTITIEPEANPSTSGQGWNFIGNPFAAAIDWDAITGNTANANINKAYWILDGDGSVDGNGDPIGTWYAYSSATGGIPSGASATDAGRYIAPGQAFFINSDANTQSSITIRESDIDMNQTPVLRKTNNSPNSFTLAVRDLATKNQDFAWIGFEKGYTDNQDKPVDTKKLVNDLRYIPAIYTQTNQAEPMIYNFIDDQFQSRTIDLYFEFANDSNALEIEGFADYLNPNWTVHLEDKLLGKFVDLHKNNYTFSHSVGNNKQRFTLHINKGKAVNLPETNTANIYAYVLNGKLAVNLENWNGQATVSVYDMQGRLISTSDADGGSTFHTDLSSLAQGLYLVKVTAGERPLHTQKIIK